MVAIVFHSRIPRHVFNFFFLLQFLASTFLSSLRLPPSLAPTTLACQRNDRDFAAVWKHEVQAMFRHS